MIHRLIQTTVIFLMALHVNGQRNADLGIRLNTAEYNRIQIEFRKPFGDFSYWRLGLSIGSNYVTPYTDLFDANDSVVTMREHRTFGNFYDLRFGMERTLKYPWLSVHGDLIFNYAQITNHNWSYYYLKDSIGDWVGNNENPYLTLTDPAQTSSAVSHWLGGGLSLGLSFNFPVSSNMIINFTGNYNGLIRSMVSMSEKTDELNEFEFTNQTTYEFYPSAGIGVRFVFDGKSLEELPAPEN